MYYSYHHRLKQLLQNEKYYVTKETGKFAYRFHFLALGKSMPIRSYRVEEYLSYLPINENNATKLKLVMIWNI